MRCDLLQDRAMEQVDALISKAGSVDTLTEAKANLQSKLDALTQSSNAIQSQLAAMEAAMRRHDIPLFTLESHDPVKAFDLVAFTIGYEMSYSNVLNMPSPKPRSGFDLLR